MSLAEISTFDMLMELSRRGGHPGALADAALLVAKKSQDYNRIANSSMVDLHNIDRTPYFPFGTVSYAQMLHTKAMRFNSLAMAESKGEKINFEGLRDTALDIINYAGFFAGDITVKT